MTGGNGMGAGSSGGSPQHFNHLPFFALPLVAGGLMMAVSYMAARSPDTRARLVAIGICIFLAALDIVIHWISISAHNQIHGRRPPYSPTFGSYLGVAGIHLVMLGLFAMISWKIASHNDILGLLRPS
ncbi:MAG: hypothetical protein QM667_08870 [Asticcacaulis sp.]